jgi:alpha-galactosidase
MHFRVELPAAWPRLRRSSLTLAMLFACIVSGLPCATPLRAQNAPASITLDKETRVFHLSAADTSYVVGVNELGELQSMYWGRRLGAKDHFSTPKAMTPFSFDLSPTATPQDYTGWGGGLYVEPDLKITFPDGNRDVVLKYRSHTIEGDTLHIQMKDVEREVYVTLEYQMDAATGILRRTATVENRTNAPFVMEQAESGTWNLPRGSDYRLRYLSGRWAGEWDVNERIIQAGKTVLESRRGTTGPQNNPWFAIDYKGATEEDGDLWFGALGWSGSWQMSIEQDSFKQVRVTGGLNSFDFGYKLNNGERFTTPPFYGGYSAQGIGGASRLLHRFEVDSILPHLAGSAEPKLRPVLYNSWEATEFRVDEAGQMALAEKAASIGVERFVMDDGWFGQRKDDHAGLGDWYVNKQKFPNGLKPLIDKVHSLNMSFGLWVEPEMVNPDSDLYRTHPDWVLNFPGRPRSEGRNQLVLNLARPDVRAYVFGFLDKLLSENDIAFLKWDYNRHWSEPGWPAVAPEEEKKVYVEFIRNYYSVMAELRKKHPQVEIESCSSGGGRVDLGVMQYTDEVWPSDNTDAFDRLTIQNGFTFAYTPAIMMAWVTDSPTWVNNRSLSLEYRFLSSMQGSLGIGANLNKWTPEDFTKAKTMVAQYKTIRETVQRGSLYRIISPENGSEHSVTESVSRDGNQAVVFAFLHSSTERYPFPRILLRGLQEDALYRPTSLTGKMAPDTPTSASGAYWMHHGVDVELRGDFQAAAFTLERLNK